MSDEHAVSRVDVFPVLAAWGSTASTVGGDQ